MNNGISEFAETRKEKSRAALRAAMLAMLGEKPFEQIQILELTSRAGIGYATFFRHYSSTDDLLDEVAGDQIRELLGMTIPAFRRSESAATLRTLCRYVSDHRALWHTLLTGGAAHSVRAEFVRQAREWSRKSDSALPPSVPVDLGTVCAAGATLDALGWWLDQGQAYSAEDMSGFIDRLIISPFVGER